MDVTAVTTTTSTYSILLHNILICTRIGKMMVVHMFCLQMIYISTKPLFLLFSLLSGANIMSVLFFLMLFTLGIDSIFAFVETIVAFIDGAAHIRQAQSKSAPSEFFKVNFLGTRCGFPLRRS